MKLLITGNAGYLGKNLLKESLKRGYEVIGIDIKSAKITDQNYIERICDITHSKKIHDIIVTEKPDVVVHCAGALAQFVSDKNLLHKINVKGTENVLQASYEANVKKFIFISSVEVYGIDIECPCPESTPLNPIVQYGKDKVESEEKCKEFMAKGMNITIFRPPTITGPGQNEPTLIAQIKNAYLGKKAFLPGGGHTKLHMVNVFDVCEAIFLAIDKPESQGAILNLGSDNIPTLREMLIGLYKYAGKKPKFLSLSAGLLRFIVHILSFLRISPIKPQHLEIALKDYTFDNSLAKKILGWYPTKNDIESACATYDWYVKSQLNKSNRRNNK
ncbi:MAG: NAD-dependent epimerase/dehydratase family protein [Promethearchaeota archaeon]